MEQHPFEALNLADSLWFKIRRLLARLPRVSALRAMRSMVHFGPWKVIPRACIRWLRPPLRLTAGDAASQLVRLDTQGVVDELQRNSVAVAGVLPAEFVAELREVTDRLPIDQYKYMHYLDERVQQLSQDPGIQDVLRAYLRCEPVLLECTLMITGPARSHRANSQTIFHVDYAGWESLNVFVYLTDVTARSAHHVVARGSHRHVGMLDALRGSLPDDEALRRFGSSICRILGPAGTLFFENTEAFHRRMLSDERRVMLNMLYASHRSWLSHGRTGPGHMQKRICTYERIRAAGAARRVGTDRAGLAATIRRPGSPRAARARV